MRVFYPHASVASESLVLALIQNNNGWARAVLSQCYSMPAEYAEALLAGEAEWKVENNTIIIGLENAPSP